ncbi:MAG: hypothetical protein Q7J84_08375 [Sulfuricaulis sp.]|nr:hypothetical protein [Sulfuricaulis sp.]
MKVSAVKLLGLAHIHDQHVVVVLDHLIEPLDADLAHAGARVAHEIEQRFAMYLNRCELLYREES